MESPSSFGFLALFALGDARGRLVPLVFLGLWQTHYLHRSIVYPLLLLIMMLLRPSGLLGSFELPFLKRILPPPKATTPPAAEAKGGPA